MNQIISLKRARDEPSHPGTIVKSTESAEDKSRRFFTLSEKQSALHTLAAMFVTHFHNSSTLHKETEVSVSFVTDTLELCVEQMGINLAFRRPQELKQKDSNWKDFMTTVCRILKTNSYLHTALAQYLVSEQLTLKALSKKDRQSLLVLTLSRLINTDHWFHPDDGNGNVYSVPTKFLKQLADCLWVKLHCVMPSASKCLYDLLESEHDTMFETEEVEQYISNITGMVEELLQSCLRFLVPELYYAVSDEDQDGWGECFQECLKTLDSMKESIRSKRHRTE